MEIKARTRDLDQIQQIDLDPKVRTFFSNVHHRLMFPPTPLFEIT